MKFYSDEYQQKLKNCVQRAIEGNESWDEILELTDTKGIRKWVRSTGVPTEINGNLVIHGSIQDVSHDFMNSQFLDSILWNSPNFIIKTDEKGVVEFFNKPIPLFEREIKVGTDVFSLFDDQESLVEQEAFAQAAETEEPVHFEMRSRGENGAILYHYHNIVSPIVHNGKLSGYIVSATDISENIRNAQELRKQQAIAEQNARLASIGELAAGIGHEINNPLSIISMSVESLRSILKTGTISPERSLEVLEKVSIATDRVSNIVKGLRTFSREDSKDLEQRDLRVVLNETVDFVRDLFLVDGIDVSVVYVDEPIVCEINVGKFHQVILNLLNNAKDAMKDEPGNNKIEVHVRLQDDFARVSISDNGPGISDDGKEKIFNAFYTTKPVGEGTGLGLYISNSIIENFGGRCSVEDSHLKNIKDKPGAKFVLSLPLAEKVENTEQIPMANDAPYTPTTAKILIVEDEEDLRDILAEGLRENGLEVFAVENGKDAIEFVRKEKFDVVISDIKMPKMSGRQLFEAIRALDLHAKPKLIFMTGGDISPHADLADHYVLKPFELNDVLNVIRNLLEREKAA